MCSCRRAHDNGLDSQRLSQKACTAPRPSRTSSQSAPRHARASSTLWLLFFSRDANACHATQRLWLNCSEGTKQSTLAPPAEIRLAVRAATETPQARCAGFRSDPRGLDQTPPRPRVRGRILRACSTHLYPHTAAADLHLFVRACARFRQWRAVCLLPGRAASFMVRLDMLLWYRLNQRPGSRSCVGARAAGSRERCGPHPMLLCCGSTQTPQQVRCA